MPSRNTLQWDNVPGYGLENIHPKPLRHNAMVIQDNIFVKVLLLMKQRNTRDTISPFNQREELQLSLSHFTLTSLLLRRSHSSLVKPAGGSVRVAQGSCL